MKPTTTPPAEHYRWTLVETAIGPALIIARAAGVRTIRLRAAPEEARVDPAFRDDAGLAGIADALRGLIDGSRRDFPYPLDLDQGTPFCRRVWEELLRIPWGQTVTYGEIARRLGLPISASRAIGRANGANPLPVVVPCHRVVSTGGKLGGYTGGLDIKEHLLRVEGVLLI